MNIRIYLVFLLFLFSASSQQAVFADIPPSYQVNTLKQFQICAESEEEKTEETAEEDDDEPDCD